MRRVIMFSGGVSSWAAARRVVDQYGPENVTLLFADTLMEDEDLYRFLDDAASNLGVPVTRICEGRTPWQVFDDVKFLGNSRVDPCSRLLKREFMQRWLEENCDPATTICYVGIDWMEEHRFTAIKARWSSLGWAYEAPLCEPPLMDKPHQLRALRDAGIRPPRLYGMGFPHNNCGGFCIKAGQGAFALLLKHFPERYAEHEAREETMRETLGDVAIMRDRRGGQTKPLTMRALRERIEAGEAVDRYDLGGCNCFGETDDDAALGLAPEREG